MSNVLAGQTLEDGGLASVVKTKQQDPQLSVRRGLKFSEDRALEYVIAEAITNITLRYSAIPL